MADMNYIVRFEFGTKEAADKSYALLFKTVEDFIPFHRVGAIGIHRSSVTCQFMDGNFFESTLMPALGCKSFDQLAEKLSCEIEVWRDYKSGISTKYGRVFYYEPNQTFSLK